MKRIIVIAALALCAGCGGSSDGDDPPVEGETFLAFATDFEGYQSWDSFDAASAEGEPASTHTSGVRTVYINAEPAAGSLEFPVGTIIVKELEGVAEEDAQVFAMVKRGGDYNKNGAANWEWFELSDTGGVGVSIVWRGVGPPAGEKYGGDPNGGCNGCHTASSANDFVQTDALSLDSF